jgi:hypothetical protein
MLGLGQEYARTGVSFAKPMPVFSLWGNLEPEAGRWVWGPLDALVLEYQSAGFGGLQILLSAESPWAASRQPKLGDLGDTFPQEQYLDDYAACDAYDMVDFHSLAHYPEIPATAAWIRTQLETNGCGEKPIWIGDAFPMSALVAFGGFVAPMPVAPVTLATRDQAVALLKAVADPTEPEHSVSEAWMEAEIAKELVKKVVVTAGAGLAGINVGNLEDWKTGIATVDEPLVPSLGASMFMGLMDTTITQKKPGGEFPFAGHLSAQARKAGDPRPGYYAIRLVQAQIAGFTAVERLDWDPGVWAYRFERPASEVLVLWYDDGALHLPGEASPSVTVQLAYERGARLTWVPTTRGESQPRSERLQAFEMLSLTLDATPVFVESAW